MLGLRLWCEDCTLVGGTAVTFFLSFRAWLSKILHCQQANPELRRHTGHGHDKLDTEHANNSTVTSMVGGYETWHIRMFGVNAEVGMTANMPALLSPWRP